MITTGKAVISAGGHQLAPRLDVADDHALEADREGEGLASCA